MAERKTGNIINMSSRAGIKPREGSGLYAIAKPGVIMLTRVLARELASSNIRVNAIASHWITTDSTEPSLRDAQSVRNALEGTPMGYIAETKDIVGTALFLASNASGYITGHTIVVDGGHLA